MCKPLISAKLTLLDCSDVPPTQVAFNNKYQRDPELQREEVRKILQNLQVYDMARFIDKSCGSGKERLKRMKKELASSEKLKKASANAVLKLSSSLQGGANWGGSPHLTPCL